MPIKTIRLYVVSVAEEVSYSSKLWIIAELLAMFIITYSYIALDVVAPMAVLLGLCSMGLLFVGACILFTIISVNKHKKFITKTKVRIKRMETKLEEFLHKKDKFLCNSTNANACSVQLAEFENLQTKIEILSSVESDFGDKVLTASSYEKRLAEIEKNIKAAKAIVDSKTSTSPKSEIEMQKEKCATLGAASCDKCSQTGVCNCVYKHSNGQKEELTCYKPELATK